MVSTISLSGTFGVEGFVTTEECQDRKTDTLVLVLILHLVGWADDRGDHVETR